MSDTQTKDGSSKLALVPGSADSPSWREKYDEMCRDRLAFCAYVENVVNPSRASVKEPPMQRHDAWACYNLITSGTFRRVLPNDQGEPHLGSQKPTK